MNIQPPVYHEDHAPRLPAIQAGATPRALVPQDFEGAWRIANAVVKSGMAPKGVDTAEKAMVAIMHGLEVGMTPMMALQSIAPINGRPSVWGDGALGLCQGSGLLEWHKEYYRGAEGADDYTAVCEVKRRGDPEVKVGTFSIADAKRAKLWGKSGPWSDYWPRMLKMRARAFALRDGFSDVLRGLHIAEEVQDVPAGKEPRQRAGAHQPPAPPPAASKTAEVVEEAEVEEVDGSTTVVAALAPPAPAAEIASPLDKLTNPAVREMVVNSVQAPPHIAQRSAAPPAPPAPVAAPAREERAPSPAEGAQSPDRAPSPAPFPNLPDHLAALWQQLSECSNEIALENTWAFEEDDINGWSMADRKHAAALYERRLAELARKG